jgi:muramidase (phage lysozyme)
VVWEVLFSDLVHLQLVMVAIPANGNDIDSTSSRYQAICLWYLANKPRQSPKLDEQLQAFAGLDAMECHLVFVPRRDVGMLLGKVRLVKAHVLD